MSIKNNSSIDIDKMNESEYTKLLPVKGIKNIKYNKFLDVLISDKDPKWFENFYKDVVKTDKYLKEVNKNKK
tara:strand:- start:390 stop:605 length:216 start_codon:yes stop_codon:yes gene_type:complete